MRWYNKERSNQMASIEYSNSPNVDTAFVVQEGGQKNRAVLTAPQDTSTLELPKNPNSTKGYVTIDGKKHKVVLTADIAGGGSGGGAVSSVNGKTGDVVLDAEDVGAVPQYETFPDPSAEHLGEICQYSGEDFVGEYDYKNGYFYKCVGIYTDPQAEVAKTAGTVDSISFETTVGDIVMDGLLTALANMVDDVLSSEIAGGTATFVYGGSDTWSVTVTDSMITDTFSVTTTQLSEYGFQIEGTLNTGDTVECTYTIDTLGLMFIDVNTFVEYAQPEGDTTISFRYSSSDSSWLILPSNDIVDITDFGVEILGTPQNNDEITITYTAPYIAAYSWQPINVQPSSGGSAREWAATVDLPANSGLGGDAYPIYTIEGGLPDGEYEFTWQIRCRFESIQPIGVVTYNARIKVDNTNQLICGMFAPELDGEWTPDANYVPRDSSFYLFYNKDGNILMFSNENSWRTDIAIADDTIGVPECFKITKIKNVETDEEYDVTGELSDGNWPTYDYNYGGAMQMLPLAESPFIPYYYTASQQSFDDNSQYLYIASHQAVAYNSSANCSELDVALSTSNGGKYHVIVENSTNNYVARVIEASGDLANTQIGIVDDYPYIYLNTTAGTTGTLYYAIGTKGSAVGAEGYMNTPSGQFTPLSLHNVGATVDTNNFGAIEQYKGTTTASYTNGYFYKATGNIVTVPASYVISNTSPDDISITCTDADGLVNAINTRTGWGISYVKEMLTINNGLELLYDFDNNVITYLSLNGIGTLDSSEYAYFTVSATGGGYVGEISVTASITTFTDASTEIQNGHWEQINVQPLDLTSITGYDATKTQTLKNVQGTLTWVDDSI